MQMYMYVFKERNKMYICRKKISVVGIVVLVARNCLSPIYWVGKAFMLCIVNIKTTQ